MVILLRKLCSDSTIFSCCFHVWSDLTKWEASNFYLPGIKTQTGLSASSLFLQQTFVNILTQWKTTQTQLNWEQFILKFNLSFDFFKETSISEFVQLGSLQQPLGQKRHIQGQMIKVQFKRRWCRWAGVGGGEDRILTKNLMGQRMCKPKYILTSLLFNPFSYLL